MVIQVERLIGHRAVLVLLLSRLLAPTAVVAQELIVPLQFSSSDPGARSMGIEGAGRKGCPAGSGSTARWVSGLRDQRTRSPVGREVS